MKTGLNGVLVASVLGLLVACGADPRPTGVDDDAAEAAAGVAVGKADDVVFAGLWQLDAPKHRANDLLFLQMGTSGKPGVTGESYVRLRCYHRGCALAQPEEDTTRWFTSAAGNTYVKFGTFTSKLDSTGNLNETAATADTYQIEATDTGISLRKTFTSRWFDLNETDPSLVCTGSGGTPDGAGGCDCSALGFGPQTVFAPGAGGCIKAVYGSEDNCGSTNGSYTDDDATAIGTYCRCGKGRRMTEDGCAKI